MGGGAYEPKKIGKPVKTGLGPSKCSANKGRNIITSKRATHYCHIRIKIKYMYTNCTWLYFVYVKNIVYLGYWGKTANTEYFRPFLKCPNHKIITLFVPHLQYNLILHLADANLLYNICKCFILKTSTMWKFNVKINFYARIQ